MSDYKVVVTVPKNEANKLRGAIVSAGGGKVGNYIHCSFTVKGTGRFLPVDLFAFPATYGADTELMHVLFWGFYRSAIGIHGRPMRIDTVTVYDANQMEQVLHQYEDRDDIKDDGFTFKNPDRKVDALKAIIKIL